MNHRSAAAGHRRVEAVKLAWSHTSKRRSSPWTRRGPRRLPRRGNIRYSIPTIEALTKLLLASNHAAGLMAKTARNSIEAVAPGLM